MIPDLDRVTSPEYLANLLTRPISEIRAMRAEGQSIENGMSYVRRVAQGRIDIVAAEMLRRRDGGDPADLSDLVARLPDILADRGRGAGPIRAPHDVTVDERARCDDAHLHTASACCDQSGDGQVVRYEISVGEVD